jgi:hypothetical protein
VFCTVCGEALAPGAPAYYSKCRACYRSQKQQEMIHLAAELEKQRGLAAKYRELAIERRLKLEALGAGGLSELTPERITALLMLAHPGG